MFGRKRYKPLFCNKCEQFKSIRDFIMRSKTHGGTARICISCFEQLREAQHNLCAICGKTSCGRGVLHIDHDHVTHKIRGLLCARCNSGLGMFGDNAAILQQALKYLQNPFYKTTKVSTELLDSITESADQVARSLTRETIQ